MPRESTYKRKAAIVSAIGGLLLIILIVVIVREPDLWLYGLFAIGAWIFSYRLAPETKNRSLEEIEEFWRK